MLTNHGPRCDAAVEGSEVAEPQGAESREGCLDSRFLESRRRWRCVLWKEVQIPRLNFHPAVIFSRTCPDELVEGEGVILCPFALLPNQWS